MRSLWLRDDAQIWVRLEPLVVGLRDLVPDAGMARAENECSALAFRLNRPPPLPGLLVAPINAACRCPLGEASGHPLGVELLEDLDCPIEELMERDDSRLALELLDHVCVLGGNPDLAIMLGGQLERNARVFLDDFHFTSYHRSERIQETAGTVLSLANFENSLLNQNS